MFSLLFSPSRSAVDRRLPPVNPTQPRHPRHRILRSAPQRRQRNPRAHPPLPVKSPRRPLAIPPRRSIEPSLPECAAYARHLLRPPIFGRWRSNYCKTALPPRMPELKPTLAAMQKKMPEPWPGLVVGYAHTLDHEYAKAIDPFNRAKAGASELGEYVAYYLGDAYVNTAHNAEALATLADFSKNFPTASDPRCSPGLRECVARGKSREEAAAFSKRTAPRYEAISNSISVAPTKPPETRKKRQARSATSTSISPTVSKPTPREGNCTS